MELERMGFDLTILAFVVLGNFSLVAIGAFLVVYLERIIKRWKEKNAVLSSSVSELNDYQHDQEICQDIDLGEQDCFQGLWSQQRGQENFCLRE